MPKRHPSRTVELDQNVAYQDMHVDDAYIIRCLKRMPVCKGRHDAEERRDARSVDDKAPRERPAHVLTVRKYRNAKESRMIWEPDDIRSSGSLSACFPLTLLYMMYRG